jgi:hypothetical protein
MTDVTAGRSAGTPQNPLRDPTRGREDKADPEARRDPTSAEPAAAHAPGRKELKEPRTERPEPGPEWPD